jgi:lysophospholipase L1-like esterase
MAAESDHKPSGPQLSKSRLAIAAIVATVLLLVIFESLIGERGTPPPSRWTDASLLSGTPIFVDDPAGGGMMTTDQVLTRFDNAPQHWLRKKEPGTFRIFCVGGSPTAGWPFHRRAGYPRFLQAILEDVAPGQKIEVINAGIHGFDTPRELGVVDELLGYQPDLIVLQTGYSDYQTWKFRQSSSTLNAWLILHSKIYNAFLSKPPDVPRSKVDQPLNAGEEARLYRDFSDQLAAFGKKLSSHHVAGAVLGLAFNDRYMEGNKLPTTIWPKLSALAKQAAEAQHLTFVDVGDVARNPEWMVDMMHPNLDGQRQVARRTAEALCSAKVLPAPCKLEKLRTDEVYAKALGLDDPEFVTRSDLALGEYFLVKNDEPRAERVLTEAEKTAPSPDFVFVTVREWNNSRLNAKLADIDRALGHPDRAERFAKLH